MERSDPEDNGTILNLKCNRDGASDWPLLLEGDFLSSRKLLAASFCAFASSQSNLQSSHGSDNFLSTDLTSLSNRDS